MDEEPRRGTNDESLFRGKAQRHRDGIPRLMLSALQRVV
jgi:hypothetical protein